MALHGGSIPDLIAARDRNMREARRVTGLDREWRVAAARRMNWLIVQGRRA